MELNTDELVSQTIAKPSIEASLSLNGSGNFAINNSGINILGFSTFSQLKPINTNVSGVLTATSFTGSGANLTNTTGNFITGAYVNAVRLVIQDPPLRA